MSGVRLRFSMLAGTILVCFPLLGLIVSELDLGQIHHETVHKESPPPMRGLHKELLPPPVECENTESFPPPVGWANMESLPPPVGFENTGVLKHSESFPPLERHTGEDNPRECPKVF